jgi:S1-C subfamily serine protease/Tfp pilus assembly protein PilF
MLCRSALWIMLVCSTAGIAQEEDLRERYGTRGLSAAQQIERGLELLAASKPQDALAAFDAALREEPECQFALFQRALALGDLGRIDEAIAAYEQTYALRSVRPSNVPVEAAMNLGLLYAHLDDAARSNLWLTRAILADPSGKFGRLGKAYRNLAVTALKRNEYRSAAACAAMGRRVSPDAVEEGLLQEASDHVTVRDEVARVLTLELPDCQVPQRAAPTQLRSVELAGEAPPSKLDDLRAHERHSLVFGISRDQSYYVVIAPGQEPTCRQVKVSGAVQSADLVGDDLYLVVTEPPRLLKVRAEDGAALSEYALPESTRSVAVLPDRNEAYLAGQAQMSMLEMSTGRVREVNAPGLAVRADPRRNLLYSYHKDRGRDRSVELLVGGQLVFIQPRDVDWHQTALFQFARTPAGLLLSWCRTSACSNGTYLALSPDGRWTAVVGGGGWRPAEGSRGGYGVAVLCATDPTTVLGFFPTGPSSTTQRVDPGLVYPVGCAFNGITNQIAVLTHDRVMVYHLADSREAVKIQAKLGGACAWTADGAWLVLAGEKGDVILQANELTEAEQERGKALRMAAATRPVSTAPAGGAAEPVAELREFAPSSDPNAARALLGSALREGRTARPPTWREFPAYSADAAVAERILTDVPEKENGIRVYRLRQALEKQPDALLLRYHLAEHLRISGQTDEATKKLLEVVHGDAGRTDLAALSLQALADLQLTRGDERGAIECLAAALLADRENPAARRALQPLVAQQGWTDETAQLGREEAPSSQPTTRAARRVLPDPPESGGVLSAAEVYARAARSVVRVQSGERSGSGFCIAPGLVLTNAHVLAERGPFAVRTYEKRGEQFGPGKVVPARVVFRAEGEDVAVLRLTDPPAGLEPLPIARHDPGVGQRVYALGHPVAGDQVLEATLSEGLVSAVNRVLEGKQYLQHSAAIHSGSSGSPLLDDRGCVVGLVTLKAELEAVGFAIPAERLRSVLTGLEN